MDSIITKVLLHINNESSVVKTHEVQLKGKLQTKLVATENYSYQIEGLAADSAPTFKQQGKDLLIDLDADNVADILIEDYYLYPDSQVIVDTVQGSHAVYDVSTLTDSVTYRTIESVATQNTPWWVASSVSDGASLGTQFLGGLTAIGMGAVVLGSVNSSDSLASNKKGSVEVFGDQRQGSVLTAKVFDTDGIGSNTNISYQWQRGGKNIVNATQKNYTLTQADVGKEITVIVKYTDGRQFEEIVTQKVVGIVKNVNDAPIAEDTQESAAENTTLSGSLPKASDVDGDNVIYSLVKPSENGKVTIKSDGSYRYTPNKNYKGKDSFSYKVDDGEGGQNSYTVSVIVEEVNNLPVAKNYEIKSKEDTTVSDHLPKATDIDGDALTYSLAKTAGNGSVTVQSDGKFTYTPKENYNGIDRFYYQVDDGSGGKRIYSTTINVTPVNDAPVGADGKLTVREDTSTPPYTDLPNKPTDVDGDNLIYRIVKPTEHGLVNLYSHGKYRYSPSPDYHGKDSFEYKVADEFGAAKTYTVNIIVTPVNDAPKSYPKKVDQAVTGNKLSSKLSQARDVDGDQITYALDSAASNGKVTVNADGSYTYISDKDFVGKDQFTYSISDGNGGSNSYTATVNVRPEVNTVPVGTDLEITVSEDERSNKFQLSPKLATDVDGDKLTYTIVKDAENGSVSLWGTSGQYSYYPEYDFHGKDRFTYKVDDSNGGVSSHTVYITVTPVNDAPKVSGYKGFPVITTGTELSGKIPKATDVDGDKVTFALHDAASNGIATVSADGSYTYTPKAGFVGKDIFTFSISDGKGGSKIYPIELTVRPEVNTGPVGANADIITKEDQGTIGNLPKATDAEGDKFTYAIVTRTKHGWASVHSNGHYHYSPKANYHGKDSFTYKVEDSYGGVNTYTANITITSVNDAPLIYDTWPYPQISIGTKVSGKLAKAVDREGDKITYALDKSASNGTVTVSADGSYTYTPKADFVGQDIFTFSVSDGNGGKSIRDMKVNVRPLVNSSPVGANADIITKEDRNIIGNLPKATDAEGDSFSYAIVTRAKHGRASVHSNGHYHYSPKADYHGKDSFTYKVEDSYGGVNIYTANITVTSVNDAPYIYDSGSSQVLGEERVIQGTKLSGRLAKAIDKEGDKITYTLDTDASHGKATVTADGQYTYISQDDFIGVDKFIYIISDDKGGRRKLPMEITVRPEVNSIPVGADSEVTVLEDSVMRYEDLPNKATDADGDRLIYSIIKYSEHGSSSMTVGGKYYYRPDYNYYGKDSFTYSVRDKFGGKNTYTVNISVEPVNDVPRVNPRYNDVEYKIGSGAIKITDNIIIYDIEANRQGNYDGMLLTIQKKDEIDKSDIFGATGSLQFNGDQVNYAGISIGDVVNENGRLSITFNENATSKFISNMADAITYKSASETAGSHTLLWQFAESSASDALKGTYEQTVSIIA